MKAEGNSPDDSWTAETMNLLQKSIGSDRTRRCFKTCTILLSWRRFQQVVFSAAHAWSLVCKSRRKSALERCISANTSSLFAGQSVTSFTFCIRSVVSLSWCQHRREYFKSFSRIHRKTKILYSSDKRFFFGVGSFAVGFESLLCVVLESFPPLLR